MGDDAVYGEEMCGLVGRVGCPMDGPQATAFGGGG